MAFGLFRLLAVLGREMVSASIFGAFAQLVLVALGGFLLSRGMNLMLSSKHIHSCFSTQTIKKF